MVKNTLVEVDIIDGRKILEMLDKTDLNISCAFWYYLTDIEEWRLIFSTINIETDGPKKTYGKIQKVLNKSKEKFSIPLEAITLISPKHQLIGLLKMFINTGPGISGARLTGNIINGILIKDAYIYRIN